MSNAKPYANKHKNAQPETTNDTGTTKKPTIDMVVWRSKQASMCARLQKNRCEFKCLSAFNFNRRIPIRLSSHANASTENANNLYLISSMKDSWAYITKRWFVSTIKTNVSFWDPFFKQPHQIRYSYVHDACNRPMVSMCKLNFTTIKAQVTISDGVVFNVRWKGDVGAWISFPNKTESISK